MSARRILKFTLRPGINEIETGGQPRWLSVGWQGEDLVVWVEAAVGYATLTRLAAIPTGDAAPPPPATYIGTAQHPTLNGGGPLVMHVFAEGVSDGSFDG